MNDNEQNIIGDEANEYISKYTGKIVTIKDNAPVTKRLSHICNGMTFFIEKIHPYGAMVDSTTFKVHNVYKLILNQKDYIIENRLLANSNFINKDVFDINVRIIDDDFDIIN